MSKYIIKRLIYVAFVFFILSIILFGMYKLVPGDPAKMMVDQELAAKDPAKFEQAYQNARKTLGFDKPVYVQYCKWMGKMLTGNFGYSSIYRKDVAEVVKLPLLNTAKLNILNLILVFAITIPLGITTAIKRYSVYDNTVQVLTVIGISLPSFIIALVCIYFFAIKTPIFFISGMATAGADFHGIRLFWDKLHHMLLPLLVMTLFSLASITRYVRGAMIDVLRMDFIRTARAKGLREKVVIYSHAFRNALIPVVTIFTWWFVGIFGGSIIIEQIFLYNGMGQIMIQSLRNQDFALCLTMNMFYIILALAGNLIMDLSYLLVDPRVKLS
ncbi:ABC transporter permease [Sedimentibacter sp. zth1]|uniref:ABC transporter permease n=1 Tax=Sedimentibacter sp. zth1 TaxID=2816908 RepID=UPI001A92C2F6|nr:ABC transporter permease [Sedimentibacter sp. zth1]QSX04722.1 ABC transporter permease [Sedimentibacter sp. zth1]